MQVLFNDGSRTEQVRVDYPIGHRRRRSQAFPLIEAKFKNSVAPKLSPAKFTQLAEWSAELERLDSTSVVDWMSLASRTGAAT